MHGIVAIESITNLQIHIKKVFKIGKCQVTDTFLVDNK